MRKKYFPLLLLVPAIVLVCNLLFVHNQRKFYMSWADPTYAYLFNGLNIANGNLTVGHIDHPGTTVQTASAGIIRLTYLFAGDKETLTADVISDPEKYIHVISFVFILINCLVLLYAGYEVLRVSGNPATAIFFQSWAIVFFTTLSCIPDLRTESFLIWGATLLVTLSFCYLHEEDLSLRKKLIYGVKFGLVCAFLVVTKFPSMTLLVVPAFLLWNWRAWLAYGASTAVFTAIFLIPAWSKLKFFFDWTGKLMTHSGIYGQGEEKIIDPDVYVANLKYIFTGDIAFALSLGIITFTLLYLLFTKRLTRKAWKTDRRVRLLAAIFVVAVAMVAIVAKHFKYHYLIPAYAVMLPGVYLSFLLLPLKAMWLQKRALQLAAVILLVGISTYVDANSYWFFKDLKNPKHETAAKMAEYKNVPRIYVLVENYSAEIQPALQFGYVYSGDLRPAYSPDLRKYYPGTYFFPWATKDIRDWDNMVTLEELVEKHPQLLVSFYYTDPDIIRETLDILMRINRTRPVITIKKVYENPATGEQLYELNRTGTFSFETDSAQVISCDAEMVLGYDMVSTSQAYKFWGAEIRTGKEAHSGKFSLQLDAQHPYGFSTVIDIEKGSFYEITVWRKTDGNDGVLVATAEAPDVLYVAGASVEEEGANGWKKIRLSLQVPLDYPAETLKIYTWTGDSGSTIYFDDLTITKKVLK